MGAPGSWGWRGNVFKNNLILGIDTDLNTYRSPSTDLRRNPVQPPVGGYYSYQGRSTVAALSCASLPCGCKSASYMYMNVIHDIVHGQSCTRTSDDYRQ